MRFPCTQPEANRYSLQRLGIRREQQPHIAAQLHQLGGQELRVTGGTTQHQAPLDDRRHHIGQGLDVHGLARRMVLGDLGQALPAATRVLLEVSDLSVRYGGISALEHVDLTVHPGEVVTLIGANGAGKTTLLRAVSRLVEPHGGSIHFDGHDLRKMSAPKAVALGIGHSPEGRRVLARQSVRDNLILGAWTRKDADGVQADLDAQLSRFPRLRERVDQPAGTLSGGEQQMLAIARALMTNPSVLLMDEPTEGLAPVIVQALTRVLARLREEGSLAIVLVIDKSGSMDGVKMQLAKRAAVATSEAINPRDQIGVVGFDSEAEVLLDLTPAGDRGTIR